MKSSGLAVLTTATPEGKELFVVCVDRDSGKILVDHKLFDVAKPSDLWVKYNSFASPTPVIEEVFGAEAEAIRQALEDAIGGDVEAAAAPRKILGKAPVIGRLAALHRRTGDVPRD